MTSGQKSTLRVLCLHGYRQTGDSFREKTGAFRKLLKKKIEFVFMTSPLTVPSLEGSENGDGGSGWWFSRSDDYFRAQDESDCIKGFTESLAAIEKNFSEYGPFDGILGFSQGAAMLGLICGLQQQGKLNYSFKFAVFVSAFISRSIPHQHLYADKIMLPTLHVFGETDQVIEKSMSEEFLQYFHEPQIIVHPGGHFIPTTGTPKASYIQFTDKMIELCNEKNT
ncbi:Ovarian cancer-associated protein 2 [Halocaridina rubra]|uniref:Ovarian cancer-associated protein 2 n=1 Tax=Halocaridina rubra TaxID=373956 RepID=A0AAN9ADR8_HALRR